MESDVETPPTMTSLPAYGSKQVQSTPTPIHAARHEAPGSPWGVRAPHLHTYTSFGGWVLGVMIQGATRNTTLSWKSRLWGSSCGGVGGTVGRERGCESRQALGPREAPSPAGRGPEAQPPGPEPTGLDVSSRERWRETSPGKLASGKARPSA